MREEWSRWAELNHRISFGPRMFARFPSKLAVTPTAVVCWFEDEPNRGFIYAQYVTLITILNSTYMGQNHNITGI